MVEPVPAYILDNPTLPAQTHQQKDKDALVRVFQGALVRFGDSARVTSLLLSSECSSVRIYGLPAGTTPADVIALLIELGHDVEGIDGLRVIPTPRSPSSTPLCTAYLSTLDLDFAERLSTSLVGTAYNNLRVIQAPPRLPEWASTRRAYCNRVQLKWSSRRSMCYIYYHRSDDALRVIKSFNDGRYRVGTTRTECLEKPRFNQKLKIYEVEAWGLPFKCSEDMVLASITDQEDTPIFVEMLTQPKCKQRALDMIKGLHVPIDSISPLSLLRQGKHWISTAQFKKEDDARKAVWNLDKPTWCLPGWIHITARLVYASTFKVSDQIFYSVKKSLQDCQDVIKNTPQREYVPKMRGGPILSFSSCSSEDVANWANAAEEVDELASIGPASKALEEVQEEYGVLLRPIRPKREIRYFGDVSKLKAVQREVVWRLVVRRYYIDLEETQFSQLCETGGLKDLQERLGDDVVSLNIGSKPKELVLRGPVKAFCDMVLHELSVPATESMPKNGENSSDCSVCLTPAEDPVVLGCGHTCCAGCFQRLCIHINTQTDVPVVCAGEGDECNKPISFKEIRDNLDSSTFERLLESSFKTYIARRIDRFRECPSPDCGYLYRQSKGKSTASKVPEWHLCPRCLKHVCLSCHATHEGLTCEQYKDNAAFEAYKRENNVKDCPRCGTAITKKGGCNHMTCCGCYAHICWRCMKAFQEEDECYEHLHQAHNTIGIADPARPGEFLEEQEEEVDE
ncbi:hypothetical protein NPX13_g8204 [Xylaria arbuscula]|uniref:RING-type domain-containing protein n=1 Tax=Xylaria arbuscula TaxID=114810 RepID=A0A9W8N8V9_9PEZI|nr:hypothetical protein NPX13_g8204 [Xylaria arbuscula]